MQSCESTDRNHIKGQTLQGEPAQDDEALWFRRVGKCGDCAAKVYVLIRGGLSSGQALISARGYRYPKVPAFPGMVHAWR